MHGGREPLRDIVFTRQSGWIPSVVREDGELKLTLGAGADANHEPRTFTFTFSISEAHLAVIRENLARHLLLWSAALPLCDAAGTRGRLDENAAIALLEPMLLAAEVADPRRQALSASPPRVRPDRQQAGTGNASSEGLQSTISSGPTSHCPRWR